MFSDLHIISDVFLNIDTGPCNEVSVEESTETGHEPFLDDMEYEASQESTAKMTDEDPTWPRIKRLLVLHHKLYRTI